MAEHIVGPAPVELTANAAVKVGVLAHEQGRRDPILRVYIQGGGCSGFQYGFDFESTPQADDAVFEYGDVKVVVDPLSLQYLMGAHIDYQEDLQGSRFVINNPNASTTCGCGSSFGI